MVKREEFYSMGSYETKKINTGKYNTFFCEGGEANSETIIFLHGSGQVQILKQTGEIFFLN